MRGRLKASRLFALSIGLLVVFAVAGFVAAAAALGSLGHERRRVVDRIDPALVATQRFQIALDDQETGVRGYVLSGDGAFLAPYRSAVSAAPAALAELYRTAGRRQAVQDVAVAARRWQSDYAEPTVAAVQDGDDRTAKAEVARGKALFDAFRARTAGLQRTLDRERRAARHRLAGAASRVRTVVTVFTLAIFLAVLATALILRRTMVAPITRLAHRVRRSVDSGFQEPVTIDHGAAEVVALAEDVDGLRARLVAELETAAEARDELQRSNTELEQFAYVASHDLQEPLRKVASFTQMLQRRYEGQLDERADQYIDFAVDGAKRMQELINDLLAFSRVGRVTETFAEVDLDRVVRRAVGDLDTDGAAVEIGELPTVRGEARLLETVFTNLISNGLKFRGDEPPVIRVSASHGDGEWCFTVADNGIGIDPEYSDRIFIIFQRLHPRSEYGGTGIGLSLCRKIIEYHGGRIWLEEDDSAGATFRFTLPEAR